MGVSAAQLHVVQRTSEQLSSSEAEAVAAAVHHIKNATIGNRTQKRLFLHAGVAGRLLTLLSSPDAPLSLRVDTAVAVGSIANGGEENAQALLAEGAPNALLSVLTTAVPPLAEACLRSLKFLLQALPQRRDVVPHEALPLLVARLDVGVQDARVVELAASCLALCCEGPGMKEQLVAVGGVAPLFALIRHGDARVLEAAMEALAALTLRGDFGSPAVLGAVTDESSPAALLFRLVRDKRPRMRLLAATCVTNLIRTGSLADDGFSVSQTVLPALTKLMDSVGTTQERAPYVLAHLVSENEAYQKAACDAGAILKLAAIIKAPVDGVSPRLRENALLAIAAICLSKEECRMQVIDSSALPAIASCLSHDDAAVREAACQCARSLSRSVKTLRSSIVDTDIATPLVKLLDDASPSVQVAACGALCNIVLDFSPMQKLVLERGGLEKFAALSRSPDNALRLNAVWALKNIVFQSDSQIKDRVMQALTYEQLYALLNDSEMDVQEQALLLVRNLAVGVNESDIEKIFVGIGPERLMALLEQKLSSKVQEIVWQALYVLVNLATGGRSHKRAIIHNERIMQHVLRYLDDELPANRQGAVWCVINLTWYEDAGMDEAVDALRRLGVDRKLDAMRNDPNVDVRERVITALKPFEADMMQS